MNRLEVLQTLYEVYGNKEFSELAQTMYLEVLKDVPLDELWATSLQYASSPHAFPPSPGELKELWRMSRGMLPPEDGPQKCVESIRKAIREVGNWGVPKFKDPITERVVKAYGWLNICASDEPEIVFAQLRDMYKGFANATAVEARLTPEFKQLMEKYQHKQLEAKDEREVRTLAPVQRGE